MTFGQFKNKHLGKGIDYDRNYGVQCFDLANQYCKDVVGCTGFVGLYAHQIYNNFNTQPNAKYFTRYANTPSFVPKKGDVVVWSATLNGRAGHVAICTGEGNTQYFYSLDQNWTGRNDPCTKVKHNYNHVLGFLRPKDQSKVLGTTTKKKSVSEIAKEVIDGKWGNGDERKKKLTQAGYNYNAVQTEVNKLVSSAKKKSLTEIAQEVIAGKWGNNPQREKKLKAAGYNYEAVQAEVNRILQHK